MHVNNSMEVLGDKTTQEDSSFSGTKELLSGTKELLIVQHYPRNKIDSSKT